MFAGSDSGGERAAAMYSLIGSCKLNNINPRAYLEFVLRNLCKSPGIGASVDYPGIRRIHGVA